MTTLDFNKKIAKLILTDLLSTKNNSLSLQALGGRVHINLAAVDSTFPNQLKVMLEEIPSKIEDHRQNQYSATLNTTKEGAYDESLTVGNLFNSEIAYLEEYLLL